MDPNDQNPTDQPTQDAPMGGQVPPMDTPTGDQVPPVEAPAVETPVGDSVPQVEIPAEGGQNQGEVMPPPPAVSEEPSSDGQPA